MKHVKKILLLFFLPTLLSLGGCNSDADGPLNLEGMTEQEIQALFVGEWKEIERFDPQYPDIIVGPYDATIIFFPDGTFQGDLVIIEEYIHYSLDKEYLRMECTSGKSNHRYLYSFIGKNKLTLDMDSGASLFIHPFPSTFIYKRIK
jgi:hypothetical protein